MTVDNTTQAPATPAPASAAPPESLASDPAVQRDQPPTGTGDPEHPAATGPEDQDDEGQGDDERGDEQGGRRNREAQYRHRAQAAEAERDSLRSQLDTLHRQIVGSVAIAHGLPEVGLLESAGHELASFIAEDGQVRIAEVIEATTATMARYSITPKGRSPKPNMQQGAYGTPSSGGGLAGTLNKALGRDNQKG
jgi:hypothetical protein